MPELLIDARLTLGSCTLDVALEVHRGPLLLVGPNGAGKSTLLRALAGGNVAVDGRIARRDAVWVDSTRGVWCPPEHRSVGYLPQDGCLFPHLTVLSNVAFGIQPTRTSEAWPWLERLDLTHLADRRARELSVGEAQRVALARALARRADLLLLDEPTAALDVLARARTRSVVHEAIGTEGSLGVVVTHDVRDLAAWGGQIALVDEQRVTPPTRIEELLTAPPGPFLAELLAPLATP